MATLSTNNQHTVFWLCYSDFLDNKLSTQLNLVACRVKTGTEEEKKEAPLLSMFSEGGFSDEFEKCGLENPTETPESSMRMT